MPDQLVTLGNFSSVTEAQIVRGVLAEQGIQAFVSEEQSVNMYAPLVIMNEGVEIKVPEVQLEQALQILEEAREPEETEEPDESSDSNSP